jgi:ribosomal protein L37AE/L43A
MSEMQSRGEPIMNDDELYQMIIKNWGTLHECPACGETALSINLDGEENCLMCGYEAEPEDDDSHEEIPYHQTAIAKWRRDQQRNRDLDEDGCPDCGCTEGTHRPATATEPGEWACNECNGIESMFDDTRYDNRKDNQCNH